MKEEKNLKCVRDLWGHSQEAWQNHHDITAQMLLDLTAWLLTLKPHSNLTPGAQPATAATLHTGHVSISKPSSHKSCKPSTPTQAYFISTAAAAAAAPPFGPDVLQTAVEMWVASCTTAGL